MRDAARQVIYLDHNATTRIAPEVNEFIARHWRESFANPGSRHSAGRRARQVLESSRESIAAILGADPDEVIFTSGGTESNNMALRGWAQGCPASIALTAGEHPSVMETARFLQANGWKLFELAVDTGGRVCAADFDELPWVDLRLVTVILAHNETGVIQDLAPLAERCAAFRIPLHTDAVQAVGKIPVNFHALGVTSLALGAHKFNGPRGVGALIVQRGRKLAPVAFGGHQELGRRPGTEPVPLIAGMARALELFHAEQQARRVRIAALRDRLEQGLCDACPPAVVNGSRLHRLANTLNVAFPGLDGEALLVALDLEGVACSLGSTCASGSAEPAPALVAMSCPADVLRSSVRFSLGIDTTSAEIEQAITIVAATVNRLRDGASPSAGATSTVLHGR